MLALRGSDLVLGPFRHRRRRQVDTPFGNGRLTLLFVEVTEVREKLFLPRLTAD